MRPLCVLLLLASPALVRADEKTIEYVRRLQTSTGGFLNNVPAPNVRMVPTLKATSSAVRALHYLKGEIPDPKGCARFVESCYEPSSGGFRDMPGKEADVFTTAVGVMAVTELKMDMSKFGPGVVKFLTANAKGFEDIRIAAAGLERVGDKSPKTKDWLAEVVALRNADGSFGKGDGLARATGGSVVTLLRLGGHVDDQAKVVGFIQSGQRKDGGFGKENEPSDLETSYRIMRAFVTLKDKPSRPDALVAFVESCRNADGGYGMTPGAPSAVGPTYFAAILKYWSK